MNLQTSKIKKCPKCKKRVKGEGNKWRPFCSERCKMLDLGAWASEDYKIPDESDEYGDEVENNGDAQGGLS